MQAQGMTGAAAETTECGGVTFRPCIRLMALKDRSRQVRQVKELRPSMLVNSLKLSTSALSPAAPSSPYTRDSASATMMPG